MILALELYSDTVKLPKQQISLKRGLCHMVLLALWLKTWSYRTSVSDQSEFVAWYDLLHQNVRLFQISGSFHICWNIHRL